MADIQIYDALFGMDIHESLLYTGNLFRQYISHKCFLFYRLANIQQVMSQWKLDVVFLFQCKRKLLQEQMAWKMVSSPTKNRNPIRSMLQLSPSTFG